MGIGELEIRGRRTAQIRGIRLLLWLGLLVTMGRVAEVRLSAQSKEELSHQQFVSAEKAYANENWQAAAEKYHEVLESDPNNAVALVHLGIADQKLGMSGEAEQCFEKAIQVDPKLPEVDILLGLVRIQLGKYREALAPLEGAFGKREYDAAARSAAGQRLVEIYFSLGQQDKALALVQRIRELAPDDPDVLYTASKVYASLWNEAVQRLLAKSPDSYRIHQILAEVAEAQGNYSEAAKEYGLIVKMVPALPGFHYRLGRTILESDKTPAGVENALQEFQQELRINPRDPGAYEQMGQLYLSGHNNEKSKQYFTEAIRLNPQGPEARIGLAKVLLAQKNYQEASEQLERVVDLSPDDESAYYNLMLAYRGLGRGEDATRAQQNFQRLSDQKEQQHSSMMRQLKGALGATQEKEP